MWLSGFFKVSEEASMRIGRALGFSVTMQKQNWRRWGWFLDGWQSTASSLAAQHNQGYHVKFLVVFATFLSTMSWPTGVIRNSKFSKQFSVFSVYMLGFIMVCGQKRFSTSRTLKLVHFLFLASLCSVGPTQTAALKCSVQPYHDRTPHPCRCHD